MRIKGMQDILEKKNLDFAFFHNLDSTKINPNIMYFAGYNGLGALVIPKRKMPFLLAPKMEYEKAKKSMVKKAYAIDKKKFFDSVKIVLKRNGIKGKKIAIDNVNFPPIVASGSNASMPHHEPENVKLKNGFCVIDFGIKYKGYCTDCKRTIYIGKPSNKEKDIYNF